MDESGLDAGPLSGREAHALACGDQQYDSETCEGRFEAAKLAASLMWDPNHHYRKGDSSLPRDILYVDFIDEWADRQNAKNVEYEDVEDDGEVQEPVRPRDLSNDLLRALQEDPEAKDMNPHALSRIARRITERFVRARLGFVRLSPAPRRKRLPPDRIVNIEELPFAEDIRKNPDLWDAMVRCARGRRRPLPPKVTPKYRRLDSHAAAWDYTRREFGPRPPPVQGNKRETLRDMKILRMVDLLAEHYDLVKYRDEVFESEETTAADAVAFAINRPHSFVKDRYQEIRKQLKQPLSS